MSQSITHFIRCLLAGRESQIITLLSILIAITSIRNVTYGQEIANEQVEVSFDDAPKSHVPKDFVFSTGGSRVKDLASFFNKMSTSNFLDPEVREQQDVIIDLPEAASKLHVLSAGYPLDIKCSKYTKLISRPNIRTFATINLLMKENKLFNEMEQDDANLLAKLTGERNFDALGKLQTILQSLESERINMRSSFEPEVQRDLLDCMKYYVYRHQRATFGLTHYIRESSDKLKPLIAQPAESEVSLNRFSELMDTIKANEKEEADCKDVWLRSMAQLHDKAVEYKLMVPMLVQEFVIDPKRMDRLDQCQKIWTSASDLKVQISELEAAQQSADSLTENSDYKSALMKLYELDERHGYLLKDETNQFVHEPNRWSIITSILAGGLSVETTTELAPITTSADPIEVVSTEEGPKQPEPITEPPLVEPVVKTESPKLGSKLQAVTSATLTDEESCNELSDGLTNGLRSTNWRDLEVNEAMEIFDKLKRFQSNCLSQVPFSRQSHWPMISMTKKLSTWCIGQVRSNRLGEQDKALLLRILETIHDGSRSLEASQ